MHDGADDYRMRRVQFGCLHVALLCRPCLHVRPACLGDPPAAPAPVDFTPAWLTGDPIGAQGSVGECASVLMRLRADMPPSVSCVLFHSVPVYVSGQLGCYGACALTPMRHVLPHTIHHFRFHAAWALLAADSALRAVRLANGAFLTRLENGNSFLQVGFGNVGPEGLLPSQLWRLFKGPVDNQGRQT